MTRVVVSVLLVLLVVAVCVAESAIVNERVERKLDLSRNLARYQISIRFRNSKDAKESVTKYRLAFDDLELSRLAFLHVESETEPELEVVKEGKFYDVQLKEPVGPGERSAIGVTIVLIEGFDAYPSEMEQNERQTVLFLGNHYFFSPYRTVRQETEVTLATTRVEHFTAKDPSKRDGKKLIFGPYDSVAPFSESELAIQTENNEPLLVAPLIEREIEISHWGNIRVEESATIKHVGAKLKQPFSRLEYTRNPETWSANAMRSTVAFMPLNTYGLYFRDEIGNVSSSAVAFDDKGAILNMYPRYPLFGGWKTHIMFGHNTLIDDVLFQRPDDGKMVLRYPFSSALAKVAARKYVLRVILPEGADDVDFKYAYGVDSHSMELTKLYLDTEGRKVLKLVKSNVVFDHNADIQVSYSFNKLRMLQKPLLLFSGFFTVFVLAMLYVRFELRITPDKSQLKVNRSAPGSDKKAKAARATSSSPPAQPPPSSHRSINFGDDDDDAGTVRQRSAAGATE